MFSKRPYRSYSSFRSKAKFERCYAHACPSIDMRTDNLSFLVKHSFVRTEPLSLIAVNLEWRHLYFELPSNCFVNKAVVVYAIERRNCDFYVGYMKASLYASITWKLEPRLFCPSEVRRNDDRSRKRRGFWWGLSAKWYDIIGPYPTNRTKNMKGHSDLSGTGSSRTSLDIDWAKCHANSCIETTEYCLKFLPKSICLSASSSSFIIIITIIYILL